MPNLFQTVPTDLFRPLAARGAPVYSEALLTSFAQTRRQQQPLSRDRAVDLVCSLLTDPEALISTEDAVNDDAVDLDDAGDDVRTRAGAILRYLTRCGWLRTEVQSDYTQTYTLPDYAFRLVSDPTPEGGGLCLRSTATPTPRRDGFGFNARHIRAHRQGTRLFPPWPNRLQEQSFFSLTHL